MVTVMYFNVQLHTHEPLIQLVEHKEGIDPQTAWAEACEKAKADGLAFRTSEVPEAYLNACGLKRVEAKTATLDEKKFGKTDLEKTGVFLATCGDCICCEYGACTKYGDPIDYTNDVLGTPDCCAGDGIYHVCADGTTLFSVLLGSPLKGGGEENEAFILQALKEKADPEIKKMLVHSEQKDEELTLESTKGWYL